MSRSGGDTRSLTTAVLALLAALTAASCGSSAGPRPALQLDVAQYMARINQWAPAEREASAAISEIFRSQFVDADLVTSIAHRMSPAIDRQLKAIASYTPNTQEIGAIHARYAGAWQRLSEGFDLIYEGMKADDGIHLAEGRRCLEAWSEEMITVAKELRKLVEAVGLSSTRTVTGDVHLKGHAG